MTATITIQELFTFILYLLGIGLLGYLITLIRNANKLVSKARKMVEENEKEIDTSLKQLPEIIINVNSITEDTKELIEKVSPDVTDLIANANSITEKADSTGEKVFDAIDVVTDSVTEAAFAIEGNMRNIADYVQLLFEIIDIIRNSLKKR